MAAPRPWTQSIEIAWRPELRFYEERFSLLRAFEDSGDLGAFRVGESHIDARLFDPVQELSVRQNGLRLDVFNPTADTDRSWDAIRRAVGRLGISRFSRVTADYQCVLGIPLDFETAVGMGYKNLFTTTLGTTAVEFDDWAFTTDLDVAGPPESSGIAEFGIVRNDELPERLERRVGAFAALGGRPGPWTDSDFEDISLFVDTNLALDVTEPDPDQTALERVHAFWQASRQQISNLTLELARQLVGNEMNEGGMTG